MTAITASPLLRSADGTLIAFERAGDGPAVILVEPAGLPRPQLVQRLDPAAR